MKNKAIIFISAAALVVLLLLFNCSGDKIIVSSESKPNPISDVKPVLKVYIENSGSMDGYMCDGSQLKDALFDYVSDLNASVDTTKLYYINNQTIPYRGDLEQYIKTLNPATFQKAGGNRSNSDLSKMFDTILNEMSDSTVCIFVSDCILDLPESDAQKFLTTCQISIKNTINKGRKRIPNLSVEIIKMMSDFNGKYFYPSEGYEVLKDVKRPYYIWIFGNNNILAKLNTDVAITELKKYGLEGIVSFSKKTDVSYEITNRALTNTTITPINGDYKATIRADFKATLQPEEVLQNPASYTFNNHALIIENVKPITAPGSPYTHFIDIVIPNGANIYQDHLILKAPQIPVWVFESNDESGKNIKNKLNKTTGIKHLIEGVADAYKKENVLTALKFTIKRK